MGGGLHANLYDFWHLAPERFLTYVFQKKKSAVQMSCRHCLTCIFFKLAIRSERLEMADLVRGWSSLLHAFRQKLRLFLALRAISRPDSIRSVESARSGKWSPELSLDSLVLSLTIQDAVLVARDRESVVIEVILEASQFFLLTSCAASTFFS